MTVRGLLRLLMILDGKAAASFRALAETTFTRVLAGDKSLIEIINANAESTDAGPTMAREALRNDPSPAGILPDDFLDRVMRKRRLEDLEYDERLVALEERRKALKHQDLLIVKNSIQILRDLHGEVIDERTTMQFEEFVKNATFTGINQSTNGGIWDSSGISIGVVATRMGYGKCSAGQLIKIGRMLANEYRAKYNQDPPKHKQVQDGKIIDVNSYMERDIDMMQSVIKRCLDSN